jgi:hypothetical protein
MYENCTTSLDLRAYSNNNIENKTRTFSLCTQRARSQDLDSRRIQIQKWRLAEGRWYRYRERLVCPPVIFRVFLLFVTHVELCRICTREFSSKKAENWLTAEGRRNCSAIRSRTISEIETTGDKKIKSGFFSVTVSTWLLQESGFLGILKNDIPTACRIHVETVPGRN